jgi:hypothetical protein
MASIEVVANAKQTARPRTGGMTGIKTEGKPFLKKNAEIGTDCYAAPVVGRS